MNPPSTSIADSGLPPPPERPDCCGSGCAICVLEIYQDQLERWQAEVERLQAERSRRGDTPPDGDADRRPT